MTISPRCGKPATTGPIVAIPYPAKIQRGAGRNRCHNGDQSCRQFRSKAPQHQHKAQQSSCPIDIAYLLGTPTVIAEDSSIANLFRGQPRKRQVGV